VTPFANVSEWSLVLLAGLRFFIRWLCLRGSPYLGDGKPSELRFIYVRCDICASRLPQKLLATNTRRHTLSLFAQVSSLFLQTVCECRWWLKAVLFHAVLQPSGMHVRGDDWNFRPAEITQSSQFATRTGDSVAGRRRLVPAPSRLCSAIPVADSNPGPAARLRSSRLRK
jgi:hypothetical protein